MGAVDYIAHLWFKCGKCKAGAMSYVALDWVDVASMARFHSLDSFEADSIIMMSREYCAGLTLKSSSDKAPYNKPEYTDEDWLARERTMEASFKIGEDMKKAAR